MKKEEEGVVIKVDFNVAKVKVGRHSDCKNCGACPGDNAMVLDVRNPLGAKPGQRVNFEVKETNMLKAAFVVYILPLIAIFFGAGAGEVIAQRLGQSVKLFQIAGGIIAFILSVVYIKFFDKSARGDLKMLPTITRIIS